MVLFAGRDARVNAQHEPTDCTDNDSELGLSLRQTPPIDTVAEIDAGEHPPIDLWQTLVDSDGFERALVDAVRSLLAGVPYYERGRTLRQAGITAAEGGYATVLTSLDRPREELTAREYADRNRDASPAEYHTLTRHTEALEITRAFGTGEITPLGRLGFENLADGPLALLDAVDATPTITVRIGQGFRERRREQREETLALLARLGTVCSIAVVATPLTARWLACEHGRDLPSEFSEQCNTGGQTGSSNSDGVDEAREAFDPDGRAVRMLRDLAAEPADTLSYHELQAIHADVTDGRVSQLVSQLSEYDLVEKYGPAGEQQIDLLPTGRELVDVLDAETGRQQRLDTQFSEPGQSSHSAVLSQPLTSGPQDGPSEQPPETEPAVPYRTRYLDRATHHGIGAAATDTDIVAAEGPTPVVDSAEERHTRFVSYDDNRDEAAVAVRATTGLQYAVSLALALASPKLLDPALPPDRLDKIDEPPAVLRRGRCIGGLSTEAVEDGDTLRRKLVEWGEDLAEMTRDLHREEYEDRDQFRGEILRSAHGLAGSIIHLLDAAGVDVIREIRTPSLSDGKMESLARTVAVGAAIQSKYGAFSAYRQLYEDREKKRRAAFSPEVDATDPLGEHIGALVLRGPRAERLGYHVEGALSSPAEIHDDAPEFSVPVTVSTPSRPAYTAAVNRMLSTKGIRATPEAVSLFQALAADVYAVTEAIRWLGEEDDARTIRLDEVRVSLAALDSDRLLTDAPPSLTKAVAELLRSSSPVSQSDLAERAGISARSLRRHLDALVTLDIVRQTEAGLRLALPFDDERGERVIPDSLTEDTRLKDVVFDVALDLVDDAGRLGDPEDPVGRPFFGAGFDLGPLRRHLPRSNPYLSVALSLCTGAHSGDIDTTVALGPKAGQMSLQDSAQEATSGGDPPPTPGD